MMGLNVSKSNGTTYSSSLFHAIRRNNFGRAMTLVSDRIGNQLDCRNFNGCTPLIETCRNEKQQENIETRVTFVKVLLKNGCDLSKCDIYGNTAMVYAEKNEHFEIAEILDRKERKLSLIENRGNFLL